MSLVSIDPGVDLCDVAWFDHGRLTQRHRFNYDHAVYDLWFDGHKPHLAVIERPVIYPYSKKKPSVMMALTRAGYLLAGSFGAPIKEYEPREWKGQLPKPMTHVTLWAVLSPAERALFPADTYDRIIAARDKGARDHWSKDGASYYGKGKGSEIHNALDACALGCVHLGRVKYV